MVQATPYCAACRAQGDSYHVKGCLTCENKTKRKSKKTQCWEADPIMKNLERKASWHTPDTRPPSSPAVTPPPKSLSWHTPDTRPPSSPAVTPPPKSSHSSSEYSSLDSNETIVDDKKACRGCETGASYRYAHCGNAEKERLRRETL